MHNFAPRAILLLISRPIEQDIAVEHLSAISLQNNAH